MQPLSILCTFLISGKDSKSIPASLEINNITLDKLDVGVSYLVCLRVNTTAGLSDFWSATIHVSELSSI